MATVSEEAVEEVAVTSTVEKAAALDIQVTKQQRNDEV